MWVPVESILEALPEFFLGTGGKWAFISEEQGNKEQRWRETRKQRLLGNREHKKTIFDCFFFLGGGGRGGGGGEGTKPIYFTGTREQVPPPSPDPWEGQVHR